jgi:hypothetical protein
MLGALLPLLVERAWSGGRERVRPAAEVRPRRVALALGIVALALIAYPAITVAGGAPRFPSYADCVQAPVDGEKVRVVFGYTSTYPDAIDLRDRALEVGFEGTDVAQDGCGRLRVSLDGVPEVATGEAVIEEARKVGLDPTLERDSD